MTAAGAVAAVAVVVQLAACRRLPVTWCRRRARARLEPNAVRRQARLCAAAPLPLSRSLQAAAVPVDADTLWTGWLVAATVATAASLLLGGLPLAAVTLAAVTAAPLLLLGAARDRALRSADVALPHLLDGVARSLRSGGSLRQSLEESVTSVGGRLAEDVRVAVARARAGVPLVTALDEWASRCPTADVRLAVSALALAAEAGGAAARPVDGVAATLRANLAVAGEIRAQASQARLSALVIALAPVGFGVLAAGVDRQTADFLLRSPGGALCLAAGLGLDAVGAWWMHRITAVSS